MHDAVRSMLDRYTCRTRDDYINALRGILQEIALLGLWRSKFFEHAAFYGGTALRVLHGLDRYSEDLDFSLLEPDESFSLGAGKLHAILCRKWKTRVKGRDWYDLVWYAGRHPAVRISHLESRMRQSGDYSEEEALTPAKLRTFLARAVNELDAEQVRREVAPFVRDQGAAEEHFTTSGQADAMRRKRGLLRQGQARQRWRRPYCKIPSCRSSAP